LYMYNTENKKKNTHKNIIIHIGTITLQTSHYKNVNNLRFTYHKAISRNNNNDKKYSLYWHI